jgi:ketosteroid isomerase-like protein
LAISFALPIFGQQTNKPDRQLRQRLVAFLKKFDEAYNKNDATAVAANFTEDAVLVTPYGPVSGRQAIEQWYAAMFKYAQVSNNLSQPDEDSLTF